MFKQIQITVSLKGTTAEKIREFWGNEVTKRRVREFLDHELTSSLFIKDASKNIEIIDNPSKVGKGIIVYFIKLFPCVISLESIYSTVVFGDVVADPFDNLATIANKLFIPIVTNPTIKQNWGTETVSKDISNKFENFLSNIQITEGHLNGITCLPLPSSGDTILDDLLSNANPLSKSSGSRSHSVPRIHELENIIIIWTKQIKSILKQDSEDIFASDSKAGPNAEIEFWRSKTKNLNGIFRQLQNPTVRRIIKILDLYKSAYNEPFIKLCKFCYIHILWQYLYSM